MMIKNTMTRTNKKRIRRSSGVVDPHRRRHGAGAGVIVTSLERVLDPLGQRIEQAEADSGLAASTRELPQYPHRGSKLHKQPPHYLV